MRPELFRRARISRSRRWRHGGSPQLRREFVEMLERRYLLATLSITGTSGADTLEVQIVGTDYVYTVNGFSGTVPLATVTDIVVDGLGGNDSCVLGALKHPTTLIGGLGDDTLHLGGTSSGNLDSIQSSVVFSGGAGNDVVTLHDSSNFFNDNYTITSTSVSRLYFGGFSYTGIEGLTLDAGGGDNLIKIESSIAATPVMVFGNGGNDTFTLGTGDLDQLAGAVTVNGGTGTDTVTLYDNTSAYGDTYTITDTGVTRPYFGGVSYSAVEGLTLSAENGGNLVKIESTTAATPITVYGNGGNDSFAFAPTGKLISTIAGPVSVIGGTGFNSILFYDSANVMSDVTHTLTPTNYVTSVSAPITFAQMGEIFLRGGEEMDRYNINGTPANTPVYLTPNRDADAIYINETGPGSYVVIDPENNSGIPDTLYVNTDDVGSAIVRIEQSLSFARVYIGSGGLVSLTPGIEKTLNIWDLLTITGSGMLDLGSNALEGSSTYLGSYQALLTSGYNAGAWNGAGICSTAAQTDSSMALGMSTAGGVRIRYTYYGDTNLDRLVNLVDFNVIAANFGQLGRRWESGDFNWDGIVNLNDFNRLAANFGRSFTEAIDSADSSNDDLTDPLEELLAGGNTGGRGGQGF